MKRSMKELRELCRKDYYSWFSVMMHHLMLYITRPLLRTNITPNQITTFWLLMQLAAAVLMVFGEYKYNVIGVLLFTGAALLDYVDGQIARIKKIKSYMGIFLEELGLYFGSPLFLIGLGIGTTFAFNNYIFFLLGIISAVCILYSQLAITDPFYYPPEFRENVLALRGKLTTRTKDKKLASIFLIFRRSNPLNLLTLLLLFNLPHLVLFIYTPLYVLKMLRVLYVQLKGLHRLDQQLRLEHEKK